MLERRIGKLGLAIDGDIDIGKKLEIKMGIMLEKLGRKYGEVKGNPIRKVQS